MMNSKGENLRVEMDGAFDISKLQSKVLKSANKKKDVITKPKCRPGKSKEEDPPMKLDYSQYEPAKPKADRVTGIKSLMDMEDRDGVPNFANGWFSGIFSSFCNKVLDKLNIEPAIKALKEKLISKNVVELVADKLCQSVAKNLEGKTLSKFTTVSSIVHAAMGEALGEVLTPNNSVDVLEQIRRAKELGRPYVIVFVGVNGVGKTTNLAKVAYWLGQKGFSIMIAPCDRFRSGAIEQVVHHVCALREMEGLDVCMPERIETKLRTAREKNQRVDLESEYNRAVVPVAKEAIAEACKDVVLIDTAGRMQNNHELMNEMGNLIHSVKPDLALFVAETLVGSDGMNQLDSFTKVVTQRSPGSSKGVLLTKFDTVDTKVGTVLSMSYGREAPVLFLGCGQYYHELRKPSINSLVQALLS